MKIIKYKKIINKKHYTELASKFMSAAVTAATIGLTGFVTGVTCKSSLITACSTLLISICFLMSILSNYCFKKTLKKTDEENNRVSSRFPIDEVNHIFPRDSKKTQELRRELSKHDSHDKIYRVTQRWPEKEE